MLDKEDLIKILKQEGWKKFHSFLFFMYNKLMKIFKTFRNYTHGQVLDLPKIQFQQEKFDNFLIEKYGVKKPIKVVFGSSPFRWVFGLFKHNKNEITLFWPGIITKTLSEKSSTPLFFALVLAHETSHFLESRKFRGRYWLGFQYWFYYLSIFIIGFWIFLKTFLFFPFNILIWLLSFLIYFILPCEVKARKFAKEQIKNNQNQWLEFFEIT